jgi:hypothetical protein
MKTVFNNYAMILFFNLLFFSPVSVWAQHYYELTPAISVSETYDDNIYLDEANEIDDYITAVTPSLELDVQSEQTAFSFSYAPSFVFYDENTEADTTRHSGSLSWDQDLTQHMRFYVTDTYYKSEEALESAVDVQGVRNTREPYWRNRGDANLQISFGPENILTCGYGQEDLKNDDPILDDGRTQAPYASLAYWFDEKNGIELDYRYTNADFWHDEGEPRRDNYKGDAGGIRYIYRFSPQTSVFGRYNLATRDFDGLTEDYDVQEGSVGFRHAFSPETSISLSGGYFVQDREYSDSEDGISYDLSFTRQFEQGRFSLSGAGGWYESFLDAEQRGFTQYHSGSGQVDFQIRENVNVYVGGSYRRDNRVGTTQEWDTQRGNVGISWSLFRYFSLTLDYQYAQRDEDIDPNAEATISRRRDYTSNRIMLTLRAGRLYRW